MTKKILLIEDEQYLRELYAEILEEAGYSVAQASNGKEGYLAICKNTYDLILLDVMLPQMDGLEILQKLKERKSLEKIKDKIVLLTNLSRDMIFSKSLSLGVKNFWIKSDLTPDQFLTKVKQLLKNEPDEN